MIGSEIIEFKHIDSTSNYVATLLKEGKIKNGMVILAEEQTDGRGQRGAKWQSVSGENLLLSFYQCYDSFPIQSQKFISFAVSIAITNCLTYFNIKSKIKWPNDILVGNKKIAGILIENQFQGSNIKSSIVGIGMNVLQKDFDQLNSTSLQNESISKIGIKKVFNQLIMELNQSFLLIETKSFDVLETKYQKMMWLLNEKSTFTNALDEKFEGIIQGTDEIGRLIIYNLKNNQKEYFDLKEITFDARNVQ
jgi:BirA family biotin operon repressor/biotin-[acetyl-CoA-carboxylase] ligase